MWPTPTHEPVGVPTYIYTGCYTDWFKILVTTISYRLGQSNVSLICPFAGAVTASVYNEGVDIPIPLRWMTKMTRMTRNLKSRPWEWLAEVYRNLVIIVILVMEVGQGSVIHIYNASQTCRVWLCESRWWPLLSIWITGTLYCSEDSVWGSCGVPKNVLLFIQI